MNIQLTWKGESYWLARYGSEWEWRSFSTIEEGFGPFRSKREALTFARGLLGASLTGTESA